MAISKDHFSVWHKFAFWLSRRWLDDKTYAQWLLNRWLGGGNITHPITFNEKIQWLKLYNRDPLYHDLVDKYAVRKYVLDKIGDSYLNECYGVYDDPNQIDFSQLPDRFVLKATHGSGMNFLIEDKKKLDSAQVVKQLQEWLQVNYYLIGREWAYKGVKPRLICERLLVDESGNLPLDYKVFCFNGIPLFVQVDVDRFANHTRAFFDTNWIQQDFELLYPLPSEQIICPSHLEEMLNCAQALASTIPFVRIDFYAIPEIFFGEMTFYPENGCGPFRPLEWDERLGKLIKLPQSR